MRRGPARRRARPPTADPADIAPPPADEEEEPERGPLRRCAVTRERLPKQAMIRFVIGPDRSVVPDLAAKLPGRGIWLSARGDVIETACTRGVFAKASRLPVSAPPDLRSRLEAALLRRIADHLGLARRAGQAVAGFAKAREWLTSGRAALVVQACDGSADERRRFLGGWSGPVLTPLTAVRLGAVFGRDHAVHVALAAGRLAETLRQDAERLAGLAAVTPMRRDGRQPGPGGRGKDLPSGVVGRNDGQDAGG